MSIDLTDHHFGQSLDPPHEKYQS